MSFMSNLAIITARGGSKRIPRKNVRDFCGKPILVYSIEAAIQSGLFDEIMVSTEDEEIAEIARRYGAKVPFLRSKKNADDYAGSEDVVIEVVDAYEELGRSFVDICCIYPTAPLISTAILRQGYDKFKAVDADALLPVVKFSYPPQRALVDKNGNLAFMWKEFMDSRSQDLEPLYHDAGAFYFIKKDVLISEKTLIPVSAKCFILDEFHVQDIDNLSDWELAEMKYRCLKEKNML